VIGYAGMRVTRRVYLKLLALSHAVPLMVAVVHPNTATIRPADVWHAWCPYEVALGRSTVPRVFTFSTYRIG